MTTEKARVSIKKRLLIGLFIVVLAGVGFSQLSLRTHGRVVEVCTFGDWPLEWAVRRQFSRKQPELRAILDFVNDAPEVSGLTVTPVGLRASPEQNDTGQYDLDKPNILQALISIEAQFVNIDDDHVVVFLGSEVRGPTNFDIAYVHNKFEVDLVNCGGINSGDREKIGSCGFSLAPNWHASYQWYPDDLDELEKALNNSN
jgi:hypothetical protein